MPRTPLLRSLVRMFRDHDAAATRGVSIETHREQAAEARARSGGVTRRQVLGGLAAGAGLIALPGAARAAGGGPKVVIVGGGIAGLSCALTLADAGVASTVYEASGRVGGRMFSNTSGYWDDGQVSEWGGELIDTGHTAVQDLCARFGLPLDNLLEAEPANATETYYFRGGYYTKAEADADFKPLYKTVKAQTQAAGYPTTFSMSTATGRSLDAMSVYDWIEAYVPGGHQSRMGALLDVAYNIEYGAETCDQSALNLLYLLGFQPRPVAFAVFGESDEVYHIRGGNQRLPQAIAATLGSAVKCGRSLRSLRRNADGRVTLDFDGNGKGETVTADYVVLALPFAVLRDLDIARAGFDALKLQSISELGRGHNGKLQLQFRQRRWNDAGPWGISGGTSFADTGYQAGWEVSRAQAGNAGILVDFTGGRVSDEMTSRAAFATISGTGAVRTDAQRYLTQIEPVFPGLSSRWNGKATSSLPHLSPLFKASYSYFRVGQYQTIAGYAGETQGGNVLFAGEHTSLDFQGFMEGGATEGIRAGEELLASLGMARSAPAARRTRVAASL